MNRSKKESEEGLKAGLKAREGMLRRNEEEKEASPKGREYLTMGEIIDKGSGIISENPLSGRFCFPVDSKYTHTHT